MPKYYNLFLVINLGCEMLYIIHQRLNPQNIASHRGIQVLTDVTEVLLNGTLLEELSSAKALATHDYIRNLLEDIVSVSIMRLDAYSMKKLWELMTMVFKWQLTLSNETNLVELTTRHLHGVSKLPQLQTSRSQGQIARAIELFNKVRLEAANEDLVLIRNAILHWFCDFRTNVSLLLRLGFQRNDGSFITNVSQKCIQELGDNIYSVDYEKSTPVGNRDTLEPTEEGSPELPFVLNFTGTEMLVNDKKKIKFSLFEQQCGENPGKSKSSISYSQSQSIDNQRKYPKINEDVLQSSSSVHDDLIKMLENEE